MDGKGVGDYRTQKFNSEFSPEKLPKPQEVFLLHHFSDAMLNWLFRVYKEVYYPVIQRLFQANIRIYMNQSVQ